MPTTIRRLIRTGVATVAAAAALTALVGAPTASAHPHRRPATYELTGDASKFEGIGVDRRSDRFYVSETTGGEIHRGRADRRQTQVWLAGNGTDGRFTARGIDVDRRGRVFIAGGPNSTDNPGSPDMWVYSRSGQLLAALRTGVRGVLVNDVAIGPDGSAYFTDSNRPEIFRVWQNSTGWHVSVWKDASATIQQAVGFNLNGIVATPDGRALLTVQSNASSLWRFDLRTRAVTKVAVSGADLTGGDGLVLKGRQLTAVRNFPRQLTTVKLSRNWRSASFVSETATPADRVFTTGKILRGRLLLVDSKFDEPVSAPPYEVVAVRIP